MAPVEIDSIPAAAVEVPVENAKIAANQYKIVNKVFELPIINDVYSEAQKLSSYIPMESTMSQLSPMVENVTTTIKTSAEENLLPRIPGDLAETIQKNVNVVLEQVNSMVGNLDNLACNGMDQLTEKVPTLKEATPMFVESTKTSFVNCLTLVAEYLASFPVGQLALKVTDLELDTVDVVLKDVLGNSEKNIIVSGVETIKKEATKIRKAGVKMAGSEKAQIIEEASLLGALAEVSGINFLLSLLGIKMVAHEDEVEEVSVVLVAGEVVPEVVPEDAPTASEVVPATPEVVPATSTDAGVPSLPVPEVVPEVIPAIVEVVPATAEVVPATAEVVPALPVTEVVSEDVLTTPEVVPAATPDACVPAEPIDAVDREEPIPETTEDDLPSSSEEEDSTEEAA